MGLHLSAMKRNYRGAHVVEGFVKHPPTTRGGWTKEVSGRKTNSAAGLQKAYWALQRAKESCSFRVEFGSGPGFFAPVLWCCMETAPTASSATEESKCPGDFGFLASGRGIAPPLPEQLWVPVAAC